MCINFLIFVTNPFFIDLELCLDICKDQTFESSTSVYQSITYVSQIGSQKQVQVNVER